MTSLDVLDIVLRGQHYLIHPDWWMKTSQDCATAALGGSLDYDAAPALVDLLGHCLDEVAAGLTVEMAVDPTVDLTVDMTAVVVISAAVLGALERMRRVAVGAGFDLLLLVRADTTVERVVRAALSSHWRVTAVD